MQFYELIVHRKPLCTFNAATIGLATKRLRILSLDGIDKIRNHLVANPIIAASKVQTRKRCN